MIISRPNSAILAITSLYLPQPTFPDEKMHRLRGNVQWRSLTLQWSELDVVLRQCHHVLWELVMSTNATSSCGRCLRRRLLAAFWLLLLALVGCNSAPTTPASPTDQGTAEAFAGQSAPAVAIQPQQPQADVRLTGSIEPRDWRELSFATTGQVDAVVVAAGDRVAKGDLLIRLDSADLDLLRKIAELEVAAQLAAMENGAVSLEQQLARAEINLQLRELELEQYLVLNPLPVAEEEPVEEGTPQPTPALALSSPYAVAVGVLEAQIDAARLERDRLLNSAAVGSEGNASTADEALARLQQARLALDQIQEQAGKLELRAPMDGIIAEVRAQPDDIIAAGETLVILVAPNRFQVRASDLAEWDVARVAPGQPVRVSVNALPALGFTGIVESVALRPEETERGPTYTVLVRLDPDNPGLEQLHWGMTADATIDTN